MNECSPIIRYIFRIQRPLRQHMRMFGALGVFIVIQVLVDTTSPDTVQRASQPILKPLSELYSRLGRCRACMLIWIMAEIQDETG